MATGGSILSFPERGPWGDPRYRGNCSGHVYRQIFEALRPRVFTDPMVGGGTSVEVAREMGIEAQGLDLHSGFNILRQRILEEFRPLVHDVVHPRRGWTHHQKIIRRGRPQAFERKGIGLTRIHPLRDDLASGLAVIVIVLLV